MLLPVGWLVGRSVGTSRVTIWGQRSRARKPWHGHHHMAHIPTTIGSLGGGGGAEGRRVILDSQNVVPFPLFLPFLQIWSFECLFFQIFICMSRGLWAHFHALPMNYSKSFILIRSLWVHVKFPIVNYQNHLTRIQFSSLRIFEQYEECTPNFAYIFSFDFLEISMTQNCSIFNHSCMNIMKPPWCTPPHWGLSNNT
jgi:hypothetical protein